MCSRLLQYLQFYTRLQLCTIVLLNGKHVWVIQVKTLSMCVSRLDVKIICLKIFIALMNIYLHIHHSSQQLMVSTQPNHQRRSTNKHFNYGTPTNLHNYCNANCLETVIHVGLRNKLLHDETYVKHLQSADQTRTCHYFTFLFLKRHHQTNNI